MAEVSTFSICNFPALPSPGKFHEVRLVHRIPIPSIRQGSQTHIASDINTARPPEERKRVKPIGDTSMGWNGAKNRCDENGHNKATPCPPFVKQSSIPCDAIDINRKAKTLPALAWKYRQAMAPTNATKAANSNE